MTTVLEQMLAQYDIKDIRDEENAIKEILQELILSALSRADFFSEAIFCGGTALRIFYGLDRFSEDLDFALEKPDGDFNINDYLPKVVESLKEYGINMEIQVKKQRTAVQSAFLKTNTLEQMLYFNTSFDVGHIRKEERIKIKLEIDTNPPSGGTYEMKAGLLPSIYNVRIYDQESLFAGKLHSILCRFWDDRVKGRDLYDFIFYVSRKTHINVAFLENAMKQSGHLDKDEHLTVERVKELLKIKFNEIDYKLAIEDVMPFIKRPDELRLWNKDLFTSVVDMIE